VTPPLNIVLINSKTNSTFNEEHRRLIAKFSPVCYAYNYHLILVNFKIETSPIDFAKELASSTSIGKSGERLIELAKKGMIRVTNLPISENFGKTIICTSKPEKSKVQSHEMISKLLKKETIALIFGCDENRNKNIRKLIEKADYHLDISGKGIKLSLDTEFGAVTNIITNSK
tara:strand:- start:8 stop:526 length:519 start_codon:yes stop_codon:yes gene_type:complete